MLIATVQKHMLAYFEGSVLGWKECAPLTTNTSIYVIEVYMNRHLHAISKRTAFQLFV